MWYWVCDSTRGTRQVFTVVHCTANYLSAVIKKVTYQVRHPESDVWIEKRREHSDRDYKQHKCPECGNLMSDRELSHTWDWAGPHCDKCGCTGMEMLFAITGPIQSGRAVLNEVEKLVKEGFK